MLKKFLLFILLIVTVLIGNFAQKKNNRDFQAMYKEAQRLYDLDSPTAETDSTALKLFSAIAEEADALKDYRKSIECYIKIGNIHQTYQRFTISNNYYHLSLYLNEKFLKDEALEYEACLYMGSSFYFSNVFDSSQIYFEQASTIALYNSNKQLPEQERLYNSLGSIYFESANYQQAKNYFEKALLISDQSKEPDIETLVSIKSNIANCLQRLNQFDSALDIYKSLRRYEIEKESDEIIRQNTAHAFFETKQYDSAITIYKTLRLENNLNKIKALNDIGRIYMNQQQWQQAETVFDSAIAVNKRISSFIRNKEEALAYMYRGQLAEKQGLLDEGLTWYNEALQEIHLNFKWKQVDDIPDVVSQTVSPITMFLILEKKASLLYAKYKVSKQPFLLKASMLTFLKCIETGDYIKLNFDNDEAKLFFNENFDLVFKKAVEVAYERSRTDKEAISEYIYVLENYKGNVLHQNLQNTLLKSNAAVPDSIKLREKEVKQMMAFYTSRINNNAAETEAVLLQKKLLELQVELSRLQKFYEKDETYNLYKIKSAGYDINTVQLQQQVSNNTALINFFRTDHFFYVLAISKNKSNLQRIAIDSALMQEIRFYLKEIYQLSEGNRYNGSKSAHFIYQQLFSPVANVIASCDNWIVIPDDILYYLPVESLIRNPAQNQYVLETNTVSYHYSFSLLFQQHTHHTNEQVNEKILTMIPYAVDDSSIQQSRLAVLPHSIKEVRDKGGLTFISAKATKKAFVEKASGYPLIHLATHASAGSDTSTNWIQFYPEDNNDHNNRLYVDEIYNLDLHRAELVVLSACETAAGDIKSGEGLISLSRAFLYAGSDGIVSTLWKSEDKVTAYLMQRLHYHLDQKHSAATALRKAKLDLLNDTKMNARFKTPYYWSNFIYIGKVPMNNTVSTVPVWAYAIAGALLTVMVILLIKKFRQRRNGFLS